MRVSAGHARGTAVIASLRANPLSRSSLLEPLTHQSCKLIFNGTPRQRLPRDAVGVDEPNAGRLGAGAFQEESDLVWIRTILDWMSARRACSVRCPYGWSTGTATTASSSRPRWWSPPVTGPASGPGRPRQLSPARHLERARCHGAGRCRACHGVLRPARSRRSSRAGRLA